MTTLLCSQADRLRQRLVAWLSSLIAMARVHDETQSDISRAAPQADAFDTHLLDSRFPLHLRQITNAIRRSRGDGNAET